MPCTRQSLKAFPNPLPVAHLGPHSAWAAFVTPYSALPRSLRVPQGYRCAICLALREVVFSLGEADFGLSRTWGNIWRHFQWLPGRGSSWYAVDKGQSICKVSYDVRENPHNSYSAPNLDSAEAEKPYLR